MSVRRPHEGSAESSADLASGKSGLEVPASISASAGASTELSPIYTEAELLTLPKLEEAMTALATEIAGSQRELKGLDIDTDSEEWSRLQHHVAALEFQLAMDTGSYAHLLLAEDEAGADDMGGVEGATDVEKMAKAAEGIRFLIELVQYAPDNRLLIGNVIRAYSDYHALGGSEASLAEPLGKALEATQDVAREKARTVAGGDWPVATFAIAGDYPRILEEAGLASLAIRWAWQNLVDVLEQRFFEGHGTLPPEGEAEDFLREQGLDPDEAKDADDLENIFARLRSFNSCYDIAHPVRSGNGVRRVTAKERTAELYRQWQHESQAEGGHGAGARADVA